MYSHLESQSSHWKKFPLQCFRPKLQFKCTFSVTTLLWKDKKILLKNPKFYKIAGSARNRMCCKSIVSITILSNITFALSSYLDKFIKIAKIFERKFYIWDQMGNLMLQHYHRKHKDIIQDYYIRLATPRFKFFRIISDNGLFSYFMEFWVVDEKRARITKKSSRLLSLSSQEREKERLLRLYILRRSIATEPPRPEKREDDEEGGR